MKFLLQYLFGYVRIKIEGFFVEKVINKSKMSGMVLWNIKRDKSTIVYANTEIKNYKKLVEIVDNNKCKIEIIKKTGVPVIIEKYKKRKSIIITGIVVIIVLITISNFVWNIQIEGLNLIDETEIVKELNDNGLQIGVLKRKINTEKIINKIRLERQDISWIGIDISRYERNSKHCRSGNKARNN